MVLLLTLVSLFLLSNTLAATSAKEDLAFLVGASCDAYCFVTAYYYIRSSLGSAGYCTLTSSNY